MKLFNEDQILDEATRVRAIKEFESEANLARKREAIKRDEVYDDNTVKYVLLKMKREGLKEETLALVENRATNISVAKKIIDKKSKVYSANVTRETGSANADNQISELAKLLNFNRYQKDVDKKTRLQKNALVWFTPEEVGDGTYRLAMKVFSPAEYDVIMSSANPTQALAIVFSEFEDERIGGLPLGGDPQVTALEASARAAVPVNRHKNYIFWTNKYHFTTDANGKIIGVGSVTPEDLINPIQMIPGVTSAENQKNKYWAQGGQDVVDGAILVNTLLTDMNAITFIQGWGQIVVTGGKNIPDSFEMGPHHALVLRYDANKDEPEPKVTVVNANPPLEAWMKEVEQITALLLSTNNLSVSSVSMKLDISQFPAGIALLIDKSESTENIEDNQQDFYWIELKEWEIIKRWHNLFIDRKLMTKEFADIGRIPDEVRVSVKFENRSGEVVTESEALSNLEKKKKLELITDLDAIMADNPGMSKEEAQKKLEEIREEKRMKSQESNDNSDSKDPAKNNSQDSEDMSAENSL